MRRRSLCLLTCCVLLLCAACARREPPATANTSAPAAAPAPAERPTPEHIVSARADAVALKTGASADAQVRLTIADGYHINANPATFSYLRATELVLTPAGGVTAGQPAYPQAVTKKFPFAPQPLAVYEHKATIRLPLRAGAAAPKGAQTLRAQVQVQPCDEEKCFPPTKIAADIPVTIN